MPDSVVLFEMRGCRAVLLMAGAAIHMDQQIKAIEGAFSDGNSSLVFDLSKALVETTCKTILNDRKITFSETEEVQQLFRKTIDNLQIMPAGLSTSRKTMDGLKRILSNLSTVVQSMAEIRNEQGIASHGKDAYTRPVETIQALLVAQSADAIVHFLYNVHLNYRRDLTTSRLTYQQNPEFNDYVDELHETVKIFDEEFHPSQILFELAEESYRVGLTEFLSQQDTADEGNSGEEKAE